MEQAVRLTNGGGCEVFSSSTRPERVSSLMTAVALVTPVPFRGPQNSPRVFTIAAETANGRVDLIYDDATLPCAMEFFRRYLSVWTNLNEVLPKRLPESRLPRCGTH